MKTRNGFISNSSSSSFVVAKSYLTNEQIKAIKKWYNEERNFDVYPGDSGAFLNDEEYYISGEVHNILDDFQNMCKKNGVDLDKIFYAEEL